MDDSVIGNGTCGDNGSSKLFEADQSITGKSCNGTIKDTKDQLTMLSGSGGHTRSEHGFNTVGPTTEVPNFCSFYRERRVEKDELHDTLEETLGEYGILDADAPMEFIPGNYPRNPTPIIPR